MNEIKYDSMGRMQYNKKFHFNHGIKISDLELEYLCKFHDHDGLKSISLALGRTEKTLANKLVELRNNGKYEYYKKLNKYI